VCVCVRERERVRTRARVHSYVHANVLHNMGTKEMHLMSNISVCMKRMIAPGAFACNVGTTE